MTTGVYLLQIENVLDESDHVETLRFASGAYYGDDFEWDIRLVQPGVQLVAGRTALVPVPSQAGQAVLANPDGALDYLADYAVDGRTVTFYTWNGTALTTVATGTAQRFQFDNDEIVLSLRDPARVFDATHPIDQYAGNNSLPNGVEGVEGDLKGREKPKVYGIVKNAEPAFVNTSRLIYQISSLDCDIDAVYDQGVLLTDAGEEASLANLEASTPASGEYAWFQGYFKLGASANGTVTADATGTTTEIAEVFNALVTEATSFTVNSSDLTALPNYDVGIFLNSKLTTFELLTRLADSIGAYWYIESGVVRIKQLVLPSSPTREIEIFQITSITRIAVASGENGLPVWRVTLNADYIETTQTEVAAAVNDATRARLKEAFRQAVSEDSATQTRHPLSPDLVIETFLRDLADAETEAARIQTLLGERRDLLSVTVEDDEPFFVGDEVTVTTTRFGYDSGVDFVVLAVTTDADERAQTLRLWGGS